MTLEQLAARVTQRVVLGTYPGSLAALIPVDAALAALAKHSYLMYRLWDRYADLTNRHFDWRRPGVGVAYEPSLLEQLRADGFAMLPDAFSRDALAEGRAFIESLHDAARPKVDAFGPDDEGIHRWEVGGILHEFYPRVGKLRFFLTPEHRDRLPRVLVDFMDHPPFHALAEAYFRTTQILANRPYMMAEVQLPARHIETWHLDCIRPTLKSFLFLGDVTDRQGPLRVLPGSHRKTEEKHRLFYRVVRGGTKAAYLDPAEDRQLDPRGRSMVGRANSVCFFDTRALHAGSMCSDGLRMVVVNGYRPRYTSRINPRMFRDPAPARMPWERTGGDDGTG